MTYFKHPNRPIAPLSLPLREPARPNEPQVTENFTALIESEMGSVGLLDLTNQVFADRVNTTTTLRYYFQEACENELAGLGFYRQGYWLRVRPGAENFIVSIARVASILHAARIRALKTNVNH